MDCKEKLPSALMKGYSRKFEKGLELMSPFEIKNKLIEFAEEHTRKAFCLFLNAGRGNPNWIATVPREAFFYWENSVWKSAVGYSIFLKELQVFL